MTKRVHTPQPVIFFRFDLTDARPTLLVGALYLPEFEAILEGGIANRIPELPNGNAEDHLDLLTGQTPIQKVLEGGAPLDESLFPLVTLITLGVNARRHSARADAQAFRAAGADGRYTAAFAGTNSAVSLGVTVRAGTEYSNRRSR